MTKTRIKSPVTTTSLTRAQVDELLSDIRQCAIRQTCLQANREAEIKAIDDRYAPSMHEVAGLLSSKTALVKQWALEHPEQFNDTKTISTIHGDFGFRLGMPALKFIRGNKAPDVLDRLIAAGLTEYIRTVQEINRQAIIDDRAKLGAEKLNHLGVSITQENSFFITPKLDLP